MRSPMDRSGEEATAVAVGNDSTPPEERRPRRCVQSKLSWHLPRAKEGESTPEEVEEEEFAKTEGKTKQKRKSQTPRKSPVTSKEARRSSARNKKSLVFLDSDLTPKVLGDSPQEEQKKEQQDAVSLKAGSSKRCKVLKSMASKKNCSQSKNKQNGEATPRKAATYHDPDTRGSHSQQRITNNNSDATKNIDGQILHIHQPVCDLWLEAKISAEENVRLSAGKQTHPFFSCRKAGKRVPEAQDIIKVESCWPASDLDYLVSGPPIHVFDTLEDDFISLDWRNWVFIEGNLHGLNGYHALENTSVFEGSVEPLKLDTISREMMHVNQSSNKVKKSSLTSTTISYVLPNGKDTKDQLLSPWDTVNVSSNISLSSQCAGSEGNLANEKQDKLLDERLTSYYQRCSYSPDCILWTNKYQPENELEVCGNRESIRFLSDWLKSWHERGLDSSKRSKCGDQCAIQDGEDSLYENGSDTDEIDDDDALKNVLLITGPIGSGKSAAIYACAKEQGFEVLEVNASDLRNGSHVKQKYGEAMESHGFNRWSCEDPIGPKRKNILELLSSSTDIREGKQIEDRSLEMTSRTCNQDEPPAEYSSIFTENRTASCQAANKTLILFEDVDIVFDEDRGFISTILQLAETAKRPIILTSNNKNPVLPYVLNRLVLDFTLPSSGELLTHLYMICASEKSHVSSNLLEQLIKSCQGDIRKTLTLLQYWCQGKGCIDRTMQFTYSPLPYDVDATHLVMPRVFPWEFQCELSEKVDEEISKAISAVEENSRSVKQQELNSTEMVSFSNMGNNVANTITTRKNRRLKRNHSFLDCTEVPACANELEDFSNALDSPVTFARRTNKHRPSTVLSSQSDDQSDVDNLPEITTVPILQMQEIQNDSELPIDPVYQSIRDDTVRDEFESSETATASHICDTFKLHDVSCVAESSFISVTETINYDFLSMVVSSNNMPMTFANFSESIHVLPRSEINGLDRAAIESSECSEKKIGDACEVEVESVHENEELEDSQNENKEPPASGYQMMDECSRVDFSIQLVPRENGSCSLEVDPVQDTWRKLRRRREDLNPYLTANQKDASLIVKLASGLTDLISETDIMFSRCTPFFSDILEPSRTPCVEPDSFSWYEEQFEIASTYAEHGLCLYTQKCALIGSNLGCENTLNLAQEMLSSSNNVMALGKLLTWENTPSQNSNLERCLRPKSPSCGISMGRELKSELYNAVRPVVPARSSMTLRGPAFHDYLSFMSQISKLEQSPLSESIRKRRRARDSRHYLSTGSLQLSQESVELLAQSSCFNGGGDRRNERAAAPIHSPSSSPMN